MSPADLTAWPAAILAAALVAAAAWAFFVRTRPPRLAAPSLTLWRQLLDDPRERSWWERVRRAVSLVLTVLIAVLLAASAIRPATRGGTRAGRLTIVLDSSWSMVARTTDGATRWAHAVAAARDLARSAGAASVVVQTTGQGVVEGPTADGALVALALDRLRPDGGGAADPPAPEGRDAVHFFTDGASARRVLPGVIVHAAFEPAPNVAVTALDARPATSARSPAQAFLEVANMAPAQRVHLTLTRETTVILDRQLTMAAGEIAREVVPLPGAGARLRARVSAAADALEIDDEAVAWLTSAAPVRTVVVSDHPETFRRLFADDASIAAAYVRPSDWTTTPADVWVFDGWLPPEAPSKPALYLGPPAAGFLGTGVRDEAAPAWLASSAHPVLVGVDPLTVDIARARTPVGPDLTPVAVSAAGTPLVSVIDRATTRAVIVGFGSAGSNLAAAPVFPILVGNAIDWLAHPLLSPVAAAGAVELPASTSSVTGPDGRALTLHRMPGRVLTTLEAPGFYFVTAGGAHGVLAVNAGDGATADLRRSAIAGTPAAASAAAGVMGRPWWFLAVLAAFAMVGLEWWTWQRRVTV